MNDVLKQSLIVEKARSLIGKVKYQMGASDPAGGISDCSGFTQYIYKMAGYDIPRTTGGVWDSELENVSKYELQPGDLVLFRDTYDSGYTDGVSHIGIYSGNNHFIHCCTAGVVESNLNDTYYKNHYLGAKRVIGAIASDTEENPLATGTASVLGLEWWGDIVKVVLAFLLLTAGVVMLVYSVKDIAIETIL